MSGPDAIRPEDHLGMVFAEAMRESRRRHRLGFRDADRDGYENFVGYGYLGLARAASRFDASRGLKFTTFAIPSIRGAILDGIRSEYKTPRKGRKSRTFVSIDEPSPDGDDRPLRALLVDGDPLPIDQIEIDGVRQAVRAIIDEETVLNRQQRRVIVQRYWNELRLHEIARRMRITESRVCQILAAAHDRLFPALLPVILGAPSGLLRAIASKRDAKANKIPRRFQQKRCQWCGKAFEPTGPNARYCADHRQITSRVA